MTQNLLTTRNEFKPFKYPWAYEAWETQNKMHWMKDEVSLADDVSQWNKTLTEQERHLLTQIFRFFTQADVDVGYGYIHKFMPLLAKTPEITMMLTSFAAMEMIHQDAYSALLTTVGMPDTEYSIFQDYKAMADKHDYLSALQVNLEAGNEVAYQERNKQLAKAIAAYSAFGEGLQLFASFAILMNFPRFGKMKGMGQIVTWSIRDESLHVESMIKLFHTFIKENPQLWTDELKKELYDICRSMVELEDKFIDLAFEQGNIEGLEAEDVKKYIRYIADRRLLQLKLKTNYKVKENPLPWLEEMLNSTELTNFFESTPTQYAKHTTVGKWEDMTW